MDIKITISPHEFRLQDATDNHGLFMHSGHYNTSINCLRHSITVIIELRNMKWLIPLLCLAHPFYSIKTGRWISADLCRLGDMFRPDHLSPMKTHFKLLCIFRIMGASCSLKLSHSKGHIHARSPYCNIIVSSTAILLSFPIWFQLYCSGFFII